MASKKPQMDKFAIAAALQEIAALMELKGGVYKFKARAYNAGARAISGVSGEIGKLVAQDRLTTLPGIGNALASQIKQLYETGESSVLKGLRQEFPPGIIELSMVPGLSLGKIKQLHESLGISSIEELKNAATAGAIRKLKGFGEKTESKLLESLTEHANRSRKPKRLHLHRALRTAEQLESYLTTARGLKRLSIAGSLRRRNETVGTIKLVASTKQPAALVQHFLRFPLIVQTETHNANKATVVLADGSRVSLTAVNPDDFAATLFAETGSKAHVNRIARLFNEKNRLPQKTKAQPNRSELNGDAIVYQQLGLPYIPPELREDTGEVDAALKGKLPDDLLELSDIQGMVHCHTTYSDGKHSIEEMARAADEMGMKYITITDHSPTAFYAGGVEIDRLWRQWDEIDEVQSKVTVKILRGTESDILASGALDYPDDVLERFDVIVASIHSRYKMDAEKMTKRVITAMQLPVFKIWGHAQGRLIQSRPPFDCDMPRILDVIAESNAAVEINGDPFRLDMEPRWVREATKRKLKFVISVDAHSVGALQNVKFGVAMARRGWVRKGDVLNALPLAKFKQAVKPV